MPGVPKAPRAPRVRIGVVVSRFHDDITGQLLHGALRTLRRAGVRDGAIEVVHVPGAFEIPLAAQALASSGRVGAIICLGCVIRGETPHFEYISSACAHGIIDAAARTGVPMSFGVLTTNTVDEATARAGDGPENKGEEAAHAALDMAALVLGLKRRGR